MTKRSNHMPTFTRRESHPDHGGVAPHGLEPEELRGDYVARHHDPVGPGVGTESAVDESETLVRVGARNHAMKNSIMYE